MGLLGPRRSNGLGYVNKCQGTGSLFAAFHAYFLVQETVIYQSMEGRVIALIVPQSWHQIRKLGYISQENIPHPSVRGGEHQCGSSLHIKRHVFACLLSGIMTQLQFDAEERD